MRNPDIAAQVNLITFEEWKSKQLSPNLIISTIRNNTPTYNESNPIPSNSKAVIMDFSWPPSIDASGISENHELLELNIGFEHLIGLGIEWDYSSTIEKSEAMISQIQQRFMDALTDKTRAKFRSFMYQTLEALSQQWEQSEHVEDSSTQLGAFSARLLHGFAIKTVLLPP